MNSQQLGKFFIPEELVRGNPEIVSKAFRDMNFVPVRTEMHFIHQQLEYAGISPMFEKVPMATIVPTYTVIIVMKKVEPVIADNPYREEYSHVEVTKL